MWVRTKVPSLQSGHLPFTFHTSLLAGGDQLVFPSHDSPNSARSAQTCWETKFFVPVRLGALGTLPCCPMPATVSSLSVKSLFSIQSLITRDSGPEAIFWWHSPLASPSGRDRMTEGANTTGIGQFHSLALSGVFKVEMFTTASSLGIPSLLQDGGAC